jgi:hypothetical protein
VNFIDRRCVPPEAIVGEDRVQGIRRLRMSVVGGVTQRKVIAVRQGLVQLSQAGILSGWIPGCENVLAGVTGAQQRPVGNWPES